MNKITIIFAFALVSNPIYAMMQNPIKPADNKIFSPKKIVLNLVASHYLLDHQAICYFAATNKYNNAFVISTANQRSEKLLICPPSTPLAKLRHKYGSARCYAFQLCNPEITDLILGYHELSNDEVITKYQLFAGFIAPLWDNQKPFFNENGDMCFYGYGKGKFYHNLHPDQNFGIEAGIFRYCIDGSIAVCTVAKAANKEQMGLLPLLPYPSLLQALLGFRGKNIILDPECYSIPGVEYSFDEITIPDDYQNKVDFTLITGEMPAFSDIPDFVKNVIEQRRQEQIKR